MNFGLNANKPATGAPLSFGAKPAGIGGVAAKVELTAEQKSKTLDVVVQDMYYALESQVQVFNQLSEEMNNVDKINYQQYFQLRDQFYQMSQLSDQQQADYELMNKISYEQIQIYEQLQKMNTGNNSHQNLFQVIIQANELQNRLIHQISGDTEILNDIQNNSTVLTEVSRVLGLK
ncbi:Hypothetical_protein [Hexamita inflata]|uniref:Hypothetical_protein n=1 Tax=Hexamita inflata TaxID=28002 RepID=A0AA86PK49_9EUKA|nr:Hypothetical protein HINF_LOCUS3128 [Hexamita inflata]CAI9938643.1 Hypothetical protein HINF_LOCUS26288 [Hexamita inflata]